MVVQFDAGSPIWSQLLDEFIRRIVSNEWSAGSRIPSVRELAAELGVNPNTVQRALAELERLELAKTERTSGRFVTDVVETIDEARLATAHGAAETYIRSVKGVGLTLTQAQSLLEKGWNND